MLTDSYGPRTGTAIFEGVLPARPLVEQVIEYLQTIKGKLKVLPHILQGVLEIEKDYKDQRIDVLGIVDRISEIASDQPTLIYGFTPFLPSGFKISCTSTGQFVVTKSDEALDYQELFSTSTVRYLHGRVERRGEFPVTGGGFADIWEGTFENRKVAIKILRRWGVKSSKYSKRLWREYRTWGDLSHPNILPFLGICLEYISETSLVPCFVSPWMDNGTILDFMSRHPEIDRLNLLIEIANGLVYLHTRDPAVVHGDIRGGNILISSFGTPCLSDFGLSRMLLEAGGMTTSNVAGSARWMAPELFGIIQPAQPVTTSSDVWAFGMTITEILTGNPPYNEVTNHVAVSQHIVKRQLPARPKAVKSLDDGIWQIFLDCCVYKPFKRPHISTVAYKLKQRALAPMRVPSRPNELNAGVNSQSNLTPLAPSVSILKSGVEGQFRSTTGSHWPPEFEHNEAAQRISDEIDKQLGDDATRRSLEERDVIKVLILGQSESGKSTTLKQIQLSCTANGFQDERLAWRFVVYFNLIRAVRRIFDELLLVETADDTISASVPNDNIWNNFHPRLSPLWELEEQLLKHLGGREHGEPTNLLWKGSLNKGIDAGPGPGPEKPYIWWDDPAVILDGCRETIEELLREEVVKRSFKLLRFYNNSDFFLDSLSRITSLHYIPSDDDIITARLKTVGAIERTLTLEPGHDRGYGGRNWKFYDTSGAKSNRYVWGSFVNNIDAMIFLVSISGFDQALPEDPRVNTVEDSIFYWQAVVSIRHLANVPIILVLNKCDLLKAKLEAGVPLNRHITSYGDRPNDYEPATKYIRRKFSELHQRYSDNPKRSLYVHLTTMTDTHKASRTIQNVRDTIVSEYLKEVKTI